MAKSWSGFLPQNENVKAQWELLSASQHDIEEILRLVPQEENEGPEIEDEEPPPLFGVKA